MKVVIVGTAYPLRGGIAHYLALLSQHLSKRHTVHTVTFSRQYPSLLFPGTSQKEHNGGMPGTSPAEQLIDSINPLTWVRAARSIAARKPDLVIFKYWLPFFGLCFGTIAAIVRRRSGARVLFICDNVIPHERRPGDVAFTRFAFQFVDHFIVQSRAVGEELKRFWPKAAPLFVPHPIYEIFGGGMSKERARGRLGLKRQKVLLFFGYIRRYKGLDTLLDAFAQVRRSLDAKLLIVGEFYHEERMYRAQIRNLGIEDSVTVISEYVPNHTVGLYFSAADVVVLPYRSATQSGIVQIAYQFDKPVIATDVGGLSEVVQDGKTGFIVPPENPPRLAEAILRFYDQKKETSFVTAVKKNKKQFSWDSMVKAIEECGSTSRAGKG